MKKEEEKNQKTSNGQQSQVPRGWTRFAPWFLTAISCIILFCLAWFLIENILWFRKAVFDNNFANNMEYRVHCLHMHSSIIRRSVGLFSGFALMFVGTGVAFYSLKSQTNIDLGTRVISAKLATASPGIIAMVLGAIIIIFTIGSKDYFPLLKGDSSNPNPGSSTTLISPDDVNNLNNK